MNGNNSQELVVLLMTEISKYVLGHILGPTTQWTDHIGCTGQLNVRLP